MHLSCLTERQRASCVGSILRALESRSDIGQRSRSNVAGIGKPRTTNNASTSASMTAVAAWRSDVTNAIKRALTFDGVFAMTTLRIVMARAFAPPKSAAAAFEQISATLRLDWQPWDVRQAYRLGLESLHREFASAGITIDVHTRKKDVAAVGGAERELATLVIAAVPVAKTGKIKGLRLRHPARRQQRIAS